MRILVTGGTGYLGLHVVKTLLEAGHAVTALVRSPERLGQLAIHPRLAISEANLENTARVAAAIRGHDACIHAALIWGEPPTEFELRDAAAAAQLFESAGRSGVRRLVLVSSTAVHRPFRATMCETDRLTTADVYGATKAAGELFLWAACATHGLEGIVVRPGPILGPPAFPGGAFRSDSTLAASVDRARRGEPLRVTRGDGRQFIAATDVAEVLARLVESSRADETYLCAARDITTWEAVARAAIEVTGSTSELAVEEAPTGAMVPTFDCGKLKRDLGMEFDAGPAIQAHLAYLNSNHSE